MRKLSQTELNLLRAFPRPYELASGFWVGGVLWPHQHPPRIPCTTYRNLHKLGLVRVARNALVEFYPLELTERGREVLRETNHEGHEGHEEGK